MLYSVESNLCIPWNEEDNNIINNIKFNGEKNMKKLDLKTHIEICKGGGAHLSNPIQSVVWTNGSPDSETSFIVWIHWSVCVHIKR